MQKTDIQYTRILLLTGFAFYVTVVLFSLQLPAFWDMIHYSAIAQYYLWNDFSNVLVPDFYDDGHMPLYSLYLAFCWKLFGKSLAVFHLAALPFMLGIVWQYLRLSNRYLKSSVLPYALVLLLFEATCLTQTVLSGIDIYILFFFLLAFNSLLNREKKMYLFSLLILSGLSLRGALLVIPLCMYDLFYLNGNTIYSNNKIQIKKIIQLFLIYFPVFILLLLWGLYHSEKKGWAFLSPKDVQMRSFAGIHQTIKNALLIVFQMLDLGRIALFLIYTSGIIWILKKKQFTFAGKPLIQFALLLFFSFLITMAPLSNPFGHRYFMPLYVILCIGVCTVLEHLSRTVRNLLLACILLSFLSGHFYYYPEKYGNGWDSSLKCLPYFGIKEQANEYLILNKIPENQVAGGFPIRTNIRYSDLKEQSYLMMDKDSLDFTSYPYIVYSNICNNFTPQQLKMLQSDFYRIKEFRSGMVSIEIYKKTPLR